MYINLAADLFESLSTHKYLIMILIHALSTPLKHHDQFASIALLFLCVIRSNTSHSYDLTYSEQIVQTHIQHMLDSNWGLEQPARAEAELLRSM